LYTAFEHNLLLGAVVDLTGVLAVGAAGAERDKEAVHAEVELQNKD